MAPMLATVVVESRLLVREALKSLMTKHSYRVVGDFGSTAEIGSTAVSEEPKLVILSAQSADKAVSEAAAVRELWPDSKIILLYERATAADFQKLLTSRIDGCVPLLASPDTLIGTLDMIATMDVRLVIAPDARYPAPQPAHSKETHQPEAKTAKAQPGGIERQGMSFGVGSAQPARPVPTARHLPRLSEREIEVLNGLVKGHANKVIARACDITEATVKVHMKAILRKIRVANRTQAAIWARENGYADELGTARDVSGGAAPAQRV